MQKNRSFPMKPIGNKHGHGRGVLHKNQKKLIAEEKLKTVPFVTSKDRNCCIEAIDRHGILHIFVTAQTHTDALNFIAAEIKQKDLNTARIVLVCVSAEEAAQLKRELAKRGVAAILHTDDKNKMFQSILHLWTEGHLNQVLIICDAMVRQLEHINVNYLVHSSMPALSVFRQRFALISNIKGIQTLILRSATDAYGFYEPEPEPDKNHAAVERKLAQLSLASSSSPSTAGPYISHDKFGVFALSQLPLDFCFDIKNLPMESHIKTAMVRLKIERAYRLQRFAWTHAAAGHSLLITAPEMRGKTWCYLPALCQRVAAQLLRRQEQQSDMDYGPCALILVSKAEQGEQIANWCQQLLDFCRVDMEPLITLFDRSNVTEVRTRLSQPCGILLTTMELFGRLWQAHTQSPAIFNAAAICCVAIDGVDYMWYTSRLYCAELLQRLFKLLSFERGQTQLFLTTRNWLRQLLQHRLSQLPDALLVFEDALEAAIFGDLKFELQTATEPAQLQLALVERLQQLNLGEQRTVCVCDELRKALQLGQLLSNNKITYLICADSSAQSQQLVLRWRKLPVPGVLIMTDDALPQLQCGVIGQLLHYSWPGTWTKFRNRFALLYSNNGKPCPATTLITVCQPHLDDLWQLCDFFMRHEQDVPAAWLKLLDQTRTKLELSAPLVNLSLCRQITAYGNCRRHRCRYRHLLWDFESVPPDHHPTQGIVEFQILNTNSPASLAVRLTKYPATHTFLNLPISKLCMDIQLHYEQSEHRVAPSQLQLGDMCVTKHNERYERVVITQLAGDKCEEVRMLDSGTEYLSLALGPLYVCDERFRNVAFQANEMRLTGLAPNNMQRCWRKSDRQLMRQEFFDRHRVFSAEVDFAFYDTIFVKNVYDDKGRDLKSFVLQKLPTHIDMEVQARLQSLTATAIPFGSGRGPKLKDLAASVQVEELQVNESIAAELAPTEDIAKVNEDVQFFMG